MVLLRPEKNSSDFRLLTKNTVQNKTSFSLIPFWNIRGIRVLDEEEIWR